MKISDINLAGGDHSVFDSIDLFNQTKSNYPKEATIHELFEEQVKKYPHKTAVEDQYTTLTYLELSEKSNQLANFLVAHDVSSGDNVALLLNNSVNVLVSILGILKANATYVPIAPSLPSLRIQFMLDDTKSSMIISEREFIKTLNKLQWECPSVGGFICLDSEDVYGEIEGANELMKADLWDYIGDESRDDISAGAWFSSYTGNDLSREEMDEYAANIHTKLKPFINKETRVLEIGCSSGISMFEIAPFIKEYYGIDLSSRILEYTRARAKELGLQNVRVFNLPANRVNEIETDGFDLIIMNSVIQCFNGHNYLRDVIHQSINLLNDNGVIFCGDIQDLELKEDLIKSVHDFYQTNPHKNYAVKLDWSNELFLSRPFLDGLANDFSEIISVEHSPKIYTIENELTKYRFDTIIKVDKYTSRSENDDHSLRKKQYSRKDLQKFKTLPCNVKVNSSQTAYIIYTSGSTGNPKGCLISHENVVRLMVNDKHPFDFSSSDVWIMAHSYSFDFSVWEMYGALLYGGKLIVPEREQVKNVNEFLSFIDKYEVTILNQTPLAFDYFTQIALSTNLDLGKHLRCVIFGGDKLVPRKLKQWIGRYPLSQIRLINMYGITETTVHVTYHQVNNSDIFDSEDKSPVGKPLPETKVYIFNDYQKIVPVGVVGELYIGGTGVAKGYHQREELTKKHFIENPYRTGERLYKTGDLGKWREDGSFEILGRKDKQVKIRGFRIELAEIQMALQAFSAVRDVFVRVVPNKIDGEQEIVAYIIPDNHFVLDSLKAYITHRFAEYMIPSHYELVSEFPLTSNGKIDSSQLPLPKAQSANHTFTGPRDETEKILVHIWQEVLGAQQVSIDANFFELGGHSLKATVVISRIQNDLNVQLSLKKIFEYPTIRGLAEIIKNSEIRRLSPIKPIEEQPHYEISHAQNRIWLLSQDQQGNLAYLMPFAYMLEGEVSEQIFAQVVQAVLERHEILRTSFIVIDGDIRQLVLKMDKVDLDTVLSVENDSDADRDISKLLNDAKSPFDLSDGPLIRFKLTKLAADKSVLIITMHHIISDGWSMEILLNEMTAIYNSFKEGRVPRLLPLSIQYKDYAHWQNGELKGERLAACRQYWKNAFEGDLPVLNINTDFPRPLVKTFNGSTHLFLFEKNIKIEIDKLCTNLNVSLYTFLVAMTKLLLFKYTNQNDIIVGSPVAGREHPDLESQIGFYVNTLALRTKFSPLDSFEEMARVVKQTVLGGFDNQYYPFDCLLDDIRNTPEAGHNPLFDVAVSLQDTVRDSDSADMMSGIKITSYPTEDRQSLFDMLFTFREHKGILYLSINYNTDLFSENRIKRCFSHLSNLLMEVIRDPGQPVSEITYLSSSEKSRLLTEFNNTTVEYPATSHVATLFEQQVILSEDEVAVKLKEEWLTYDDLNNKANQLARYISDNHFVVKGDRIGIGCEKTCENIVAIVAILKLGGCYVPVDLNYPEERLKQVIDDAGLKLLLVGRKSYKGLPICCDHLAIVDLHELEQLIACYDNTNIEGIERAATDDMYILFTSGTSGVPKGVIITHRNVIRLVKNTNFIDLSEKHKLLSTGPLSFDASTFEIWGMLLNGGELQLIHQNEIMKASLLKGTVAGSGITTIWFTSALFHQLVEDDDTIFSTLKYLLVGGDRVSQFHVNKIINKYPGLTFIHLYGPTEGTCFALFDVIATPSDRPFPLGQPINNTSAYILDDNGQLVGQWITGEIYLGGDGVGKGYLNAAELESKKFIDPPSEIITNSKLYRTGDLGFYDEQGRIHFVGRNDDQVKVRGHRIEPAEIEFHIIKHPDVKNVAVRLKTKESEKHLVVYIDAENGKITEEELHQYTAASLPEYMVPARFVIISGFPLNANGKIDWKLMPEPEGMAMRRQPLQPETSGELRLKKLWIKILGVDDIGIDNNFFLAGGHSLKAMRLISAVQREFGVNIDLKTIFSVPTIRQLSSFIEKENPASIAGIPCAEIKPYYEVSFAQRRIWYLEQQEGIDQSYTIAGSYLLEGHLAIDKFEQSLQAIIERHECLRTTFITVEGQPVQKINTSEDNGFNLLLEDISHETDAIELGRERANNELTEAFDLECGPLIRAKLIKIDQHKHLFLLTFHHIVSDGWSMDIFKQELFSLYNSMLKNESCRLPALNIKYKDFAEWQRRQLLLGEENESEQFWLKQFSDDIPVLTLPYKHYRRSAIKTYTGSSHVIEFSKVIVQQLEAIQAQHHTSVFTVVLSLVEILLHKYSGQSRFRVGCLTSGRPHGDIENLIGFFVNTIALQANISPEITFNKYFDANHKYVIDAFKHQHYSFDVLLEKLNVQWDRSRSPLFDVMVGYNEKLMADEEAMQGLTVKPFIKERPSSSKFDLTFDFVKNGQALFLALEYNTDLFSSGWVEGIEKHFIRLVTQIADGPDLPLQQISIYPEHENDFLNLIAKTLSKPACDINFFADSIGQLAQTDQVLEALCHQINTEYNVNIMIYDLHRMITPWRVWDYISQINDEQLQSQPNKNRRKLKSIKL